MTETATTQTAQAPVTSDSGAATGANVGLDVGAGLAQVVAGLAAVTNSINEITNKINALESRVKQTTANEDTNFEASVTGVHDPFDDVRRTGIVNNKLALSMAENADALMKEYLKYTAGVWARSLDHYCAMNPEVSPRAAKT